MSQSHLTLYNPMNCSMPGLPVLHHLPESAQTLSIELVMPSNHPNPLSSPSPPAFNLSQPRDWTCISCVFCLGRQILYHCAMLEALTWAQSTPNFYSMFLQSLLIVFLHLIWQWCFSNSALLKLSKETCTKEDWLGWFPCSPRDSQKTSPTPQLESINS